MAITIRTENLRNDFPLTTRRPFGTLIDYHRLTKRCFSRLPAQGKIVEVAKRLCVIAAPIIYPTLAAYSTLQWMYWSLNSALLLNAVDGSLRRFCQVNFVEICYGVNPPPHRMVILFHLKVSNRDIYTEMIELSNTDQPHPGNTLVLYRPEMENFKRNLDEIIKRHASIHFFNNVEIEYQAFSSESDGTFHSFNYRTAAYLFAPQGHSGSGGTLYGDDRQELVVNFNRILNTMHPTNQIVTHNFASHR